VLHDGRRRLWPEDSIKHERNRHGRARAVVCVGRIELHWSGQPTDDVSHIAIQSVGRFGRVLDVPPSKLS